MSQKHKLIPRSFWFHFVLMSSLVITSSVLIGNIANSQSLTKKAASKKRVSQSCVVSGCSGQLCVEASRAGGAVTTCEWREEYGCYQDYGVCERQANGNCAWTATEELSSCLMDARDFPVEVDLPYETMLPSTPAPSQSPAPSCPRWMINWFGFCLL